ITNGSFNPARSIGPAIFAGGWALEQLWLFIVAPLAGGVLAAGVFAAIRPAGVQITSKQAETVLPSQQQERRQVR
ncbi:MAG TPA: aquaporin, partial [Candidatus Angelobacter sp.]|nr:aquaporin [Candidatus Angelobacter sp.]